MTETSIDNRPYITSSGRDLRLDFLRGYFILIMIIDHIAGPSPLYWFTGGIQFFISGAEGFFLISGLVTGIVYHRIIESKGLEAALQKMLQRILVLYLVAISINLVALLLIQAFWVTNQPQPNQIIRILSLQGGGVITAYVFLYIMAPLALLLLNKGAGKLLLTMSWLWYIMFVFFPETASIPYNTFTNVAGLQVLFFSAMYVGFKKYRTLDYGQTFISKNWLIVFVTGFLLFIIFFFMLHPLPWMSHTLVPGETAKWLNQNLFNKQSLRPGRLIVGILVYGTFFNFVSLYWEKIKKFLGWLIMPLGTSALYAFTLHIPIRSILAQIIGAGIIRSGYISNMLIQIFAVLLIWFFTSRKILAPNKDNIHSWYYVPFVLAGIMLFIDFLIHTTLLVPYYLRALVYWITWFPIVSM